MLTYMQDTVTGSSARWGSTRWDSGTARRGSAQRPVLCAGTVATANADSDGGIFLAEFLELSRVLQEKDAPEIMHGGETVVTADFSRHRHMSEIRP